MTRVHLVTYSAPAHLCNINVKKFQPLTPWFLYVFTFLFWLERFYSEDVLEWNCGQPDYLILNPFLKGNECPRAIT